MSSGGLKQEIKDEFSKEMFLFRNCNPQLMYKCQLVDSALPLLIYRLMAALFTITIFCIQNIMADPPGISFLFFTVWTFIVLMLYFSLATVISIIHYHKDRINGRKTGSAEGGKKGLDEKQVEQHTSEDFQEAAADTEREQRLPWYMIIQWILYNIALTGSILVTLVYWGALYPLRLITDGYTPDFMDIAVHALNVIIIIIEQYLSAIPSRLTHVIYPMIYGITYAIYSLILYITTERVLYPFVLDWSNPGLTMGSITGILIYCCIAQFVLFLIYRAFGKCASR